MDFLFKALIYYTMFLIAFMGFGIIDALMEAQGRIQIASIGSSLALLILIRTEKEPTKQTTEKEEAEEGN